MLQRMSRKVAEEKSEEQVVAMQRRGLCKTRIFSGLGRMQAVCTSQVHLLLYVLKGMAKPREVLQTCPECHFFLVWI